MEQQTEAIELANSILIEVSKTSVTKWHEKLKTRYGWFKTDNCKNIIFDVSFVYFPRFSFHFSSFLTFHVKQIFGILLVKISLFSRIDLWIFNCFTFSLPYRAHTSSIWAEAKTQVEKNTILFLLILFEGNITVVLYEDPPDQIPKIHIRSNKYMAWIAEQQMPVHMHVEKVIFPLFFFFLLLLCTQNALFLLLSVNP